MHNGKFIVSLDFELMWGVRDKKSIKEYGGNIIGEYHAIPQMLELFKEHDIKATFATVGFLFFKTKKELLKSLPQKIPEYINEAFSPYESYISKIGENFTSDPYHFAPQLIKLIKESGHEIGTHTYSHYYCLEQGQSRDAFKADLIKAIEVANKSGIKVSSLVFPRNQLNLTYLDICEELKIHCIRGTGQSWLYSSKKESDESLLRRAIRLIDAYINISGHQCYSDEYMLRMKPVDIPGSRFLRPYSRRLRHFDFLRFNRIKNDMTYAARNNLMYHLWWHPHNFGADHRQNLKFLQKILHHYQYLNKKFKYQNYSMSELADKLIKNDQTNSQQAYIAGHKAA